MNKKSIIPKVLNKKQLKDYTYAILFLSIASFFLFFAVRPALKIAFSLRRELVELRDLNVKYEKAVVEMVRLQEVMERVRENKDLIMQAIPQNPETASFISTIKEDIDNIGFQLDSLNISGIKLKSEDEKKIETLGMQMQVVGDFNQAKLLVKGVTEKRRIINISDINLEKEDKDSTNSGSLNIDMNINGYYLK